MNSIIKHLAIATKLLNQPVAEEALASNVARDRNLNANIQSLSEVLRSYGFENHISRRKLLEIPSLAMPAIIILNNEEAAVITDVKGHGEERTYVIRQGDAPAHEISHKDLESKYLGFCWFIKPKLTADHRSELPEYHLPKAWFWKVIARFKKYYYQVILASFLINILALISSLYVMNVYDRVIPNEAYSTLWVLSIGVFLAILFEFIAKMIRSHLTDIAGKKADLIISSALFRRVMALRLIERPISSGSYANNLRDFEAVREFMTSASLLVLVDAPFLLLFLFVMFIIGGKLAIVPAVICTLVLIVSFAVQPVLAKRINESMRESSQRQGLAVEAVEGIETLKVNNATNWAQQRWDRLNALTATSSMKVKEINEFVSNLTVGLQQLNTVGLVLLGTYLIHDDVVEARITMGAVIASVILSGRALSSLGRVAGLAIRFQQAKNALKGVNAIVERPIERSPERSYVTLTQVQGQLTFKNVVFQYNEDTQPAIANLNLTIRPGEKVAILGRIGSGKSTLLKLAGGLYEPTGGNILLDDVDTRQIDPNFLRDKVTLLNQSPRLFLGTLRENLDLARMDGYSTDQELLAALRNFHLDQLVRNHPKGLDMPLGEDGLGLSGGQKQIVSLARLTLRHPRVVLLDEPTTGLDEQTERQALNVLAQWARDKTVVVVTHRLQVLPMVNRVVVVDNGRVVMDGPRDAVIARLQENEARHNQATPAQTSPNENNTPKNAVKKQEEKSK
ncbi:MULTISPECIES: type I secretion system permease/ATPase [Haemophilus]|uniref:type I secretion system permease/ATPase n=1 Tax=Haemophilus TaxID=724 RepID=UPI000ABBAE7D|nr:MULTISPECIES: type I secretion system permease/ATPase [Haemophilus]KAB1992612.1 type I secretion system permease/ATPase [Haemophilus parainfluenzae]MBS6187613.1 type I secretion system permease/ATPase [Haemophilus parainfluenzae]MDN3210935.1 type I secretion system permease/ATPase [Haemophilus sp. SZY H51]MDU4895896.1 type I secretion system permease/ATPase [Haemophilus parainfluenzae]QAT94781.1 type I secretion system permease/ATPase [Haemophilus parainfluenzae]